jgi:hypothetical protein
MRLFPSNRVLYNDINKIHKSNFAVLSQKHLNQGNTKMSGVIYCLHQNGGKSVPMPLFHESCHLLFNKIYNYLYCTVLIHAFQIKGNIIIRLFLYSVAIWGGGGAWITTRLLDWIIGFIDTLYIQLGTTGNYTANTNLHTLQFTVTHALEFSVFNSRIMATDL